MPPPAEALALGHYRRRKRLVDAAAAEARRAWRLVDATNLVGSWRLAASPLLVALTAAQLGAARAADDYLDAVLAEQGIDPVADGGMNSRALAGVASDGRDLDVLLDQPMIATLTAVSAGATVPLALATGYAALDMIVRTQVADAGRVADQVGMAARRNAGGYVRMVVGKTCSRCIVLAGKWYRWNAGFKRHPRCDCVHVPSRESLADVSTDPRKAFDAMSRAEQDKVFTKAGADAIRLGANPAQVVNARRGMQTASVYGRQMQVTTEGVTTRGVAGRRLGANETGVKVDGQRYRSSRTPRLMPEQILAEAKGDRDEAIRLLRRFGYIL